MFQLVPHADHPARSVLAVNVNVARNPDGGLWLEYGVNGGAAVCVPNPCEPRRMDGLWRTTCFELFYKPEAGEAYFEFNFSPSYEWAVYEFSSYRTATVNLVGENPEIEMSTRSDPWFFLAAEPCPNDLTAPAGTFGLSAVIEEADGTKSYWALTHAPGPPDFHNPACFIATLPAPDTP